MKKIHVQVRGILFLFFLAVASGCKSRNETDNTYGTDRGDTLNDQRSDRGEDTYRVGSGTAGSTRTNNGASNDTMYNKSR